MAAVLAAAALLGACKEAPAPAGSPPPAAAAPATAVSIDDIASQGQGFNVGPSMSARTVYVFFDPQCPHCGALWQAAKPLRTQARFVWLPVGLLNANSTLQGAALLAAADPATAMDLHEVALREGRGGMRAEGENTAQKDAVKKNTELMNKYGFGSVPTVVAKHAQTGETVVIEGSAPTATLAQRLGLPLPN